MTDPDDLEIDITVPHMARVYDYLLGGGHNFAVDRTHAEHVCAALPGGIEAARANIRANRVFLREAVQYLAGERGVRQFLDIGTGIPNADNVHAVAQQTAPGSRVVYVDHDPVVLAHAHELLRGTSDGVTAYVDADLRDPGKILARAGETVDLTQPVAVMLVGVLHYIEDDEDPYGIVATLLDAVAPGSYLVVSHLASDIQTDEMAEFASRHNRPTPAEIVVLRDHTEVSRFFEGVNLVGAGVVPVNWWRPDQLEPEGSPAGRKPTPTDRCCRRDFLTRKARTLPLFPPGGTAHSAASALPLSRWPAKSSTKGTDARVRRRWRGGSPPLWSVTNE